jgi:hypothetical protein
MRLPPAAHAFGQHLGRALTHPLARWAAAGLLLALAGVFLLGPTPGSVARELPPAADWALPAPPSFDAAALAARRAAAPLWASQPAVAPPQAAGPALAAPPQLIAMFRDAGGDRAVFRRPDGSRLHARPGEPVGEGFELLDTGPTHARLRAADGRVLEQRLLGPRAALE